MCGINGILRLRPDAPPLDHYELACTRDAMASRGPDGTGSWVDEGGDVALGHRRLAILDLSAAAAQPMHTRDGRHALIVNGEIYNFRALRRELERDGACLRSSGDTEVVLELLARHGERALGRLRGMFALAWWDGLRRRLVLARDPLGIKPLYYATDGATLRFASQVRALVAGGVSDAVDPAGLVGFLLWGSVPEPWTIRRAVRSLPAGHFLVVEAGRVGTPAPYPITIADDELLAPATAAAAVDDAVRAHLVADVPVAVFLSAGLDSAMVAAVAARAAHERGAEPPTTITVRFAATLGTRHDEGPLAAQIARRLDTRHLERTLAPDDLAEARDRAVAAMDQPSIDGVNTWVVSRVAREAGCKVVLSGLGGDEVFGSYPSFRDVPRWAQGARALRAVPGLAPVFLRAATRLAPKKPKLRGLLRYATTIGGAYFLRRGLFLPEEIRALVGDAVADAGAHDPVAQAQRAAIAEADSWAAVQRLETSLYLRNQLLRDADWASMAHSVELRVPFVDAVLADRLARLGFEPARSAGKAVLAQQVAPELPRAVFARRKSGFYVPLPTRGGAPQTNAREQALYVLRSHGIELPAAPVRSTDCAAAEFVS